MGLETKLKFVSGVFVVSISVLLSDFTAAKILVFYFDFFFFCYCLLDWLMWLVKANLDGFL